MTTRRLFLAALSTIAAAAAPATASAVAPVWQAPTLASAPGPDAVWAQVAAAPDGSLVTIWQQSDGSNLRLVAKTRSAAGVWGSPEFVSNAGEDTGHPSGYLVVAAGDSSFTIAWMSSDYSAQYLSVQQPGASTWSEPSSGGTIDAGEYFQGGTLAAGPDNSTIMLTTGGVSGDHKLRVRQRAAGSDTFTVTSEIDENDGESQVAPAIAYNGSGNAIASWTSNSDVRTASYDAGTDTWSSVSTLMTEGTGVGQSKVAINDQGVAVVLWTPQSADALRARTLDPSDGSWSAAAQLFVSGPTVVLPALAADRDGNFVSVWQEFDYSDQSVPARALSRTTHGTSGSWSSAEDITVQGGAPALGVSANGDMIVSLMTTSDGVTPALGVAFRESGSAEFEPVEIIKNGDVTAGNAMGVLSAALDPDGNAMITYPDMDGSNSRVGVALGDATPPTLESVSVPSSATAGDTVSFTASAFDLWSGLDATTWNFGDGGSATGSSASHTYSAAGTYTVSVTSTDLAGFSSATETRQITVEPAPEPDTDESDEPAPPKVLPPVLEARLSGKKITLNTRVTLRGGKKCTGKATATTKFGNTTYRTTLTLKKVNGKCVGTGTIKLKKAPSTRTKLRVTVSAKSIKTRTLTTKRG